jgi:ubiquinone/menaquinone biosynthesis C-methylase UbiE
LKQLTQSIYGIVGSQNGLILDAACGPGTYGRRIASQTKTVYGADASMSMMRQGARYVARNSIPNVHFARAKVEALPFPAGLFDAAICAGALNHFSDIVLALREIGRTMKAGAPLAVACFFAGSRGPFKYKSVRERTEKRRGGHIPELADLDRYVAEAGFEEFRPHEFGSILVFSARKG